MENYHGDLADIVRAGGGPITDAGGGGAGFSDDVSGLPDWRFPADPMTYMEEPPVDDFGDPFSSFRDPLLHELEIPSSGFFSSSTNSRELMKTGVVEDTTAAAAFCGGGGLVGQKIGLDHDQDQMILKRPTCNYFSRMLQISPHAKLPAVPPPCDSPVGLIKPSPLVPNDLISAVNTSKSCLVENTGVQISSPRNTGIKRRKSQAKKVVCIPAPAPANSRPSTGEVVPSDLWAWRKYGQKPIKGSPYPRGYYRCSSSKGCSARKQVERSRTDPNMLVITYTSEHNHPWPTQRNALAGSTRSQPSKNNSASKNNSSAPHSQKGATSLKEEEQKKENDTGAKGQIVKEEVEEFDKEMEMDNGDQFSELGFPQSYRPILPDPSNHSDQDFFADLGEIEADPLKLLFTQGFPGDEGRENNSSNKNKANLDSFTSIFDWTENNSNSNSTSFGEAKKGL